jgi:hypothetical protein
LVERRPDDSVEVTAAAALSPWAALRPGPAYDRLLSLLVERRT